MKRRILIYTSIVIFNYFALHFFYVFMEYRYGIKAPADKLENIIHIGVPTFIFSVAFIILASIILSKGELREKQGYSFFENKPSAKSILVKVFAFITIVLVCCWYDIKDIDLFLKDKFTYVEHLRFLKVQTVFPGYRSGGSIRYAYYFKSSRNDTLILYNGEDLTRVFNLDSSKSVSYKVEFLPNTKRLADVTKE